MHLHRKVTDQKDFKGQQLKRLDLRIFKGENRQMILSVMRSANIDVDDEGDDEWDDTRTRIIDSNSLEAVIKNNRAAYSKNKTNK